jgi:hypothetical protein
MDKLPEPSFDNDKTWPRIKLGVQPYIEDKEKNLKTIFFGLSALSIGRYWREINFYKKDHPFFLFIVIPTFLFSSYQIADFLSHDAHAYAAMKNNDNERSYIESYKSLWREAKKKSIEIPDELVQ